MTTEQRIQAIDKQIRLLKMKRAHLMMGEKIKQLETKPKKDDIQQPTGT